MADQKTDPERPWLTPHLSAEHRYHRDNTYRHVVDALCMLIAKLEMTPSEVREAAVYACIRWECLNLRSVYRNIERYGLGDKAMAEDMKKELDHCRQRVADLERWLEGG